METFLLTGVMAAIAAICLIAHVVNLRVEHFKYRRRVNRRLTEIGRLGSP